jgi:hypothetical protein
MAKLIYPITFIDKLIKKNERGDSFSLLDHQAGNPAPCLWLRPRRPAAVGHDSLFLRQEVGEDDDVDQKTKRFFRLTKENQKRKIDACVSFAILAAVRNGRPVDFETFKNLPPVTTNSKVWRAANGNVRDVGKSAAALI